MKIAKRIALVLVIFTPVALAGLTDTVAFLLFVPGLLLVFVPASILLVFSVILFVPVIRLYREGRVLRTTFLALIALQSIILIFWLEGWTAASAFLKHSRGFSQSVIDPQLEHLVMIGFWLLVALVFALFIEHLVDAFLNNREAAGKRFYLKRMVIVALEGLLLLGMYSGLVNYKRQAPDTGVAISVSPEVNPSEYRKSIAASNP